MATQHFKHQRLTNTTVNVAGKMLRIDAEGYFVDDGCVPTGEQAALLAKCGDVKQLPDGPYGLVAVVEKIAEVLPELHEFAAEALANMGAAAEAIKEAFEGPSENASATPLVLESPPQAPVAAEPIKPDAGVKADVGPQAWEVPSLPEKRKPGRPRKHQR